MVFNALIIFRISLVAREPVLTNLTFQGLKSIKHVLVNFSNGCVYGVSHMLDYYIAYAVMDRPSELYAVDRQLKR